MSYFLLPKNNIMNTNIHFSLDKKITSIPTSIFHYYTKTYNEINTLIINDSLRCFYNYEKIIKIMNPYEYIYSIIPGSKFSVSKLKTKSLLFYDLIEINQLLDLFGSYKNKKVTILNGGRITPEKMAKLSPAKLRTAGVSGAKAKAIGELTDAVLSRAISFHKFPSMTNEEISHGLTNIWGIGRWTVEMFLMFHLGRLDVWPVGDLAMRRGWEKLHGLEEDIHPKELDKLGDQFAGHQSVVAWYCWRATEGESSSW